MYMEPVSLKKDLAARSQAHPKDEYLGQAVFNTKETSASLAR